MKNATDVKHEEDVVSPHRQRVHAVASATGAGARRLACLLIRWRVACARLVILATVLGAVHAMRPRKWIEMVALWEGKLKNVEVAEARLHELWTSMSWNLVAIGVALWLLAPALRLVRPRRRPDPTTEEPPP